MDVENQDLLSTQPTYRPLADRLRPRRIEHVIGQTHLLDPGKPLYQAISHGHIHSMILWGPPGTGKTTLARLFAETVESHFLSISAVLSGVKEIRAAIDVAQLKQAQTGRSTVLFVDEVHRFNKSQQDAFLPHIESGVIQFVGATTENPAFELNNALLSRARVYVLRALSTPELIRVIERALNYLNSSDPASQIMLADDAMVYLAELADGDARRALNLLETAADFVDPMIRTSRDALSTRPAEISVALLKEVGGQRSLRFDKAGDRFYDTISALHKSVRGSKPDAALYWFACMLEGGADPLYIARRVVRIASEDIGNADPRALSLALDAWDVQQRLGSPEGELAIAQAIIYLASAAKSNAVYAAFKQAQADARQYGSLEVPQHLRNAPTSLAQSQGHGKHYRYAHDEAHGYAAGQTYLPEPLRNKVYYQPVERGLEAKISERLRYLAELDLHYNEQNEES
ncbi:MAG: replication-associated recombination protein A [Thiohalomonadales bacterium]